MWNNKIFFNILGDQRTSAYFSVSPWINKNLTIKDYSLYNCEGKIDW